MIISINLVGLIDLPGLDWLEHVKKSSHNTFWDFMIVPIIALFEPDRVSCTASLCAIYMSRSISGEGNSFISPN